MARALIVDDDLATREALAADWRDAPFLRYKPSEKSFDQAVTRRQLLCDKAQGETSSEIELALVRYRKVA